MKLSIAKSVVLLSIVSFVSLYMTAQSSVLIPAPVSFKQTGGYFNNTSKRPLEKQITWGTIDDKELGTQGYLLRVTENNISISALTNVGRKSGLQTFKQLQDLSDRPGTVPCVEIRDYPRFGWRGMHLDVSRHFYPVSFIKKYLDILAYYKLNRFHWHLTDDQGWRIEIKKYPLLTSVGGYRNGTIVGHHPGSANDNLRYGGFYTQEEVKEVVAYAGELGISVVPEIEMPGHASAAIAAYPFLSCFPDEKTGGLPDFVSANTTALMKQGQKKFVQETWGVFDDIFCAGKDGTFLFMQDVLSEVAALFPYQYIHIGGDEAPKTHWEKCPNCKARMATENLKDAHELQSYFIKRIEKYLQTKNKSVIGWDEILEGGLAPNAAVMSWRGEAGGIEAAKQSHYVVMSPGKPMYFDHYQGEAAAEPLTIGGLNTIEMVYNYDPIPAAIADAQKKFIMGAQANLWTEYQPTTQHVVYMLLPRLLALSETLWAAPANKNWGSFTNRLHKHFRNFAEKGWNYRPQISN